MISIILPAFNEEKSIRKTISLTREILRKNNISPFEIIIIDDGSSDNTFKIALNEKVKVIKNPHNLGYGISLKKGINAAKYETLIIMDADLTYPTEKIPDLIKKKK